MVIEGLRDILFLLVASSAAFAAIAGLILIQTFFGGKLKELFSDVNYFIFFFLGMGYTLYAVGEVVYYLVTTVLAMESQVGISDVYWSFGALMVVASFFALSFKLHREARSGTAALMQFVLGGIIVVAVLFLLFWVILGTIKGYFFGYFYPIMSSLIVAFALSVFFHWKQLGALAFPLFLFFCSSLAILFADLLFAYGNVRGIYIDGPVGLIADMLYFGGYLLSLVAFLAMQFKTRVGIFKSVKQE